MTAADFAVEVSGLSHKFGAVQALDQVSFAVGRATLFALLGPNGCGKTTLFRILTTMLAPQSGQARVAGADVVASRARVLHSIGVVFQKPSLDGKLTVLENLMHQGRLYGQSGSALKARSLELLSRFGVADRAHDRVSALSGGLQRRVELAKGMLHGPQVLILDEPSTGLDPAARSALMGHLTELRDRDGVTSLLTTHLMDEADRCDTVAVMDRGRLLKLDAPETLKGSIGGDIITVKTRQAIALAERITERFGVPNTAAADTVRMEKERGFEFVPQLVEAFPGQIEGVSVSKPSLEDVFMQLTGHRFDGAGEGPVAEASTHRGGPVRKR